MCTLDVNALQEFNVHNTQETTKFHLYTSLLTACQSVGPLPFCLLPPSNRLSSMCSSTLQSYFQAILNDNTDPLTLDDMPIVWDSVAETSNLAWIDVPVSQQELKHHEYIGLKPVPHFVNMATNETTLLGVHGGTLYTTNRNGFVDHYQHIKGANDAYQHVGINHIGDGFVMYSDALYVLSHQQTFTPLHCGSNAKFVFSQLVQRNSQSLLVSVCERKEMCTLVVYEFETRKTQDIHMELKGNQTCMWTVVDITHDRVLVAIYDNNNSMMSILNFPLQQQGLSKLVESHWTNIPFTKSVEGYWQSVLRQSDSFLYVTTLNQSQQKMYGFKLDLSYLNTVEIIEYPWVVFSIVDCASTFYVLTQQELLVVTEMMIEAIVDIQPQKDNDVLNYVNQYMLNHQEVNGIALDNTSTLCVSGTQLWCMTSKGRLYHCPISTKLNFTSEFDLYEADNAIVSDFGDFSTQTTPSMTWFFGYNVYVNVRAGDVLMSPHQYFRLLISPVVSSPTTLPHVTTQLQRANFRVLAQSGLLQLYDNSQTQIVSSTTGDILWQRNTNDTWGSNTRFSPHANTSFDENTKLVSPNGCYILFTPPNSGPRVVMNVFNNNAFTQFVQQSPERLAQALQKQSDFCWSELRSETALIVTDDAFTDRRCMCITGPRLLQSLYPQLNSDLDSALAQNSNFARINQNFPCLSKTCQEVLIYPESTNVYASVQAQCQNAPLTLCSSVLTKVDTQTQLNIREGFIFQQCNGALPLQCDQDTNCPIGSVCVFGKCVKNCANDTDCAPSSKCENGICVKPQDPKQPVSMESVMLIAVAIAFLIVMVVFLAIWFRRRTNK